MLKGRATSEGTARFRSKFPQLPATHWRQAFGLTVSSIGMGSYLGPHTDAADRAYAGAARRALQLGCNLIDSAINYRFQRSERAIGMALRDSGIPRDEVVLCSKAGFVPFDGEPPRDPAQWFRETFVKTGVAQTTDVVANGHVMTPKYIRHQLEQSLKNFGVETIDVYYVHNPETQLEEVSEAEFNKRLAAVFQELEKAAAEDKIQVYGTATWSGYLEGVLQLERIVRIARQVGGEHHHFRIIQLPYNAAMLEALTTASQQVGGRAVPVLQAAQLLGITVVTSVPLLQTRLLKGFPEHLRMRFPGLMTDAQRLIQFVRSTPGVLAPLVGMSRVEHVEENLATARTPPLVPDQFRDLFGPP